jgi:hypothetical protein
MMSTIKEYKDEELIDELKRRKVEKLEKEYNKVLLLGDLIFKNKDVFRQLAELLENKIVVEAIDDMVYTSNPVNVEFYVSEIDYDHFKELRNIK